jgi:hypothetical protein
MKKKDKDPTMDELEKEGHLSLLEQLGILLVFGILLEIYDGVMTWLFRTYLIYPLGGLLLLLRMLWEQRQRKSN